ncbi:c-type cytochrome [Solitalea canadensis]|uniref:Cytochrome c, mono-and diheme variants family n=1 Tax=Solitalea canadensis (strain ATCC 29591 / DSM 3403 / JCM 21819 / LMG 8368 / NBRC 15130 / NCIMB 12057 / USAM 9D) TaxID=929556 RepID=H8KR73_SOLCM|nr:cytochrome c [Solitalea canadensis]AFD07279.1 cytochrome c, mono- and diheme variants family [Solitalea canadensis DSM 3403]
MKTNLIGVVMVGGLLLSFTYYQTKPWVVPEKNAKMANPVKADAASLKTGKEMWTKHCASCHGKTGLGDGTKAASLKTAMEDLTTAAVQKQSDGALYYKVSEGREEMPSFKKKIPDSEDLWSIVNYMRTFKK